ncbi:porin family protein [Flavihumibacter petaseus]|uniref:Outer membrane protein beta-barrel domain-containing protein n=1 Tax=Flavihumibacter petaseus NBRC 106054 TaxID=1220578 RepID=A0A0E9N0E2_9BACT|nr:porin family protein [Flavihumibacter petaseus]GAO43319.1 hypothetical protein FPE01S_02_04240 [Flavihumibacter petaseus NBRC 106054]
MKVKLLLAAALFCAATATQAQGLHFGIKGGANITKVDGKAMSDEFNFGYHLGGFAEIGFGKKIFIQPELLWSQYTGQTGSDFSDIVDGALPGSNNQDIKLNYLQIPITLNYRLLDWLSLQAGPQFSVLLDNEKSLLENSKDAFSAGDFSIVGGAQINFGAFRVTGRYFTSLNDISSSEIENAWKNKGFQIGVGFKIL